MCIRDRRTELEDRFGEMPDEVEHLLALIQLRIRSERLGICLLYTSDAADDLLCVDLGGRRIIKKKHNKTQRQHQNTTQHNPMTHN